MLSILLLASIISAGTTTNFGWDYGTRGQTPWWDVWENIWRSVDSTVYDTSKTIQLNAQIPSTRMAFGHRVGTTFYFPSWTMGSTRVGLQGLYVQMDNQVNESDSSRVETAVAEFQGYQITANSKAPMHGIDLFLLKQFPCVQSNPLIGSNIKITSSVPPVSYLDGVGINVVSDDQDTYVGTMQNIGLRIGGARGWEYPIAVYYTDDVTPMFSVGQYGDVYASSDLSAYVDITSMTGDLITFTAGKGIILKNAAGTVTKRVRLNDAGTGLIFETP